MKGDRDGEGKKGISPGIRVGKEGNIKTDKD